MQQFTRTHRKTAKNGHPVLRLLLESETSEKLSLASRNRRRGVDQFARHARECGEVHRVNRPALTSALRIKSHGIAGKSGITDVAQAARLPCLRKQEQTAILPHPHPGAAVVRSTAEHGPAPIDPQSRHPGQPQSRAEKIIADLGQLAHFAIPGNAENSFAPQALASLVVGNEDHRPIILQKRIAEVVEEGGNGQRDKRPRFRDLLGIENLRRFPDHLLPGPRGHGEQKDKK